MRVKTGVRFVSSHVAMCIAHTVVAEIYRVYGCECVITSAADGVHSPTSKHPDGGAFDYSTHTIHALVLNVVVLAIKQKLCPTYDVILEDRGKANEHLHVEYDPKTREGE